MSANANTRVIGARASEQVATLGVDGAELYGRLRKLR